MTKPDRLGDEAGLRFSKTSNKYEQPIFSFYFPRSRPWNHAQIVDLTTRIPPKRTRALYDQIWPTWCHNKVATFNVSWKFNLSLLFLKEQALKPCPNCRSHDEDSGEKNESFVRPNLTNLVSKQGCDRSDTWQTYPPNGLTIFLTVRSKILF